VSTLLWQVTITSSVSVSIFLNKLFVSSDLQLEYKFVCCICIVAGVNNSSSVLMNLLTTGVDTNYGYRLSKPVHQLAEVITKLIFLSVDRKTWIGPLIANSYH
jgi:hypothetical protein